MPTEPHLSHIQAWLHTYVVAKGDDSEALRAAERKAGFESGSAPRLIKPSPTLTPEERIKIYRGMYLLRMRDALEIDFPVVRAIMGKEDFSQTVERYVESHPSNSYTLDHLGRHFSQYLEEEEKPLLSDMARLEWALCEVAVAHDAPTLEMKDLASVREDRFMELVFSPVPALEILTFRYNINELYKAWGADESLPKQKQRRSHLVVWRHELNTWRMELSPVGHAFLTDLLAGAQLGESLDTVIGQTGCTEEELFGQFQNWVQEGFFSDYSLSLGNV